MIKEEFRDMIDLRKRLTIALEVCEKRDLQEAVVYLKKELEGLEEEINNLIDNSGGVIT